MLPLSFVNLNFFVQRINKLCFAWTLVVLIWYFTEEYEDDFEPEDDNEEETPADAASHSESPTRTNLSVNAMELIDSKVSQILQAFGVPEREESQADGVWIVFFPLFYSIFF